MASRQGSTRSASRGGVSAAIAPKKAVGVAPAAWKSPSHSQGTTDQTPSYSSTANYSGTGTPSYSSSSSFSGGAAPVVSDPSEEDYLAGDSGYQTQLSALTGALKRYLADADFQRNTYQTDYNQSLRDLGYDEGAKSWNWNDKLTASGRGYQNQLDDFASRGMLQSQGYADAFQELQRMLGQQYDSMSQARTTFNTDLDNQIANYKAENTSSQQAARAEAIARRAAQYGL